MTTHVVISDLFTKSRTNLDGSVTNRIVDFITKLQNKPDSPGLDLKTPTGVTDPAIKTARVTDYYRAVLIALPESAGYILASVQDHDKAYDYARKLRYGVNQVTGAFEVANQAEIASALDAAETPQARDEDQQPLLANVSATTLETFGVDPEHAQRLIAVTDENKFYEAADALPRAQSDAVLDLLSGRSPEDVWADLVQSDAGEEIDTDDVAAALARPLSRLSFVSSENQAEFQAALEEDLDTWRIWLHPLQRRIAEHQGWNGPYRVTGGAGTGKTVVAIHRARNLADRVATQIADGALPPGSKVLVTTFTKNLARAIEAQLVKLADAKVLEYVEVVNIDAVASRIWRNGNNQPKQRICGDTDDAIVEAWSTAGSGSAFEPDFLAAEWRDVVLAQGIRDRSAYLSASRAGRGRRLSRPQRAEVWQSIERFQNILASDNLTTFLQIADRASDLAVDAYPYGVIDEAQDLHPAHWRLLRAAVREGQDDLFIVGDAHQRIYGKPIVLSRMGVHTRGRSRRLTVNYRTSRQILAWCLAVAYGEPVDDLEGEDETLGGARSMFDGPEPIMRGSRDAGAEAADIAAQLTSWFDESLAFGDIAIVARSRRKLDDLEQALTQAGIPVVQTGPATGEATLGDRVQLMTMHRAKGLEYRAMVLAGIGAGQVPPPHLRTNADDDAVLRTERNLVYVAGSRARERLFVSWTGNPSELLEPAIGVAGTASR